MAKMLQWFYRQLVGPSDFNDAQANLQNADWSIVADQQAPGIMTGLSVAQASSPNMTVNVTQGVAYDQNGARVFVPSTQNVSMTVDSNGAAISTPTGVSNTKIVSVAVKFARNNSDPQIDGNSVSLFYQQAESFQLVVVQGTEGNPGVAPALDPTTVLLADVTLSHGQTSVVNSNIDLATRREMSIVIPGSPYALFDGTYKTALSDLLAHLNDHVNTGGHPATAITYAGSGTWTNGLTGIAAGSVEAAIDAVVAALASTTTSASGSNRVGSASLVGTSVTIVAGSVYQQLAALSLTDNINAPTINSTTGGSGIGANALSLTLAALKLSSNLDKAAGPSWANGDVNSAGSLSGFIDGIISGLASTSLGTSRIGGAALPTTTGGHTIGAGAVFSQLTALKSAVNIDFVATGVLTSKTVGDAINELDARRDVQVFTSNGSWAKPSWVTNDSPVDIEIIGGGGGGQSGARLTVTNHGGASGGGGGVTRRRVRAGDLASSVTVIIGNGGSGGAAVTTDNTGANAGTSGGDTQFGSLLVARGGVGGTNGFVSLNSSAGDFPGGTSVVGTDSSTGNAQSGSVASPGAGAGGAGGASDSQQSGGNGGLNAGSVGTAAAAGTTSGTKDGTNGTSTSLPGPGNGGGGGAGNDTGVGGNGGAGSLYGGGGGGGGSSQNGHNSGAGGAGAQGRCRVFTSP